MLRRTKKKDPATSAAPSSSQSLPPTSSDAAEPTTQLGPAGRNGSSTISTSSNNIIDDRNRTSHSPSPAVGRRIPASNPAEAMPPPSSSAVASTSQPHHHHHQQQQQQQQQQQSEAGMGRSPSTLGFLFSKAKNTINTASPSSQHSQPQQHNNGHSMPYSGSISSLANLAEQDELTDAQPITPVYQQHPHSFANASSSDLRSHAMSSRPSVESDMASVISPSPSKKPFWSRDRKISTTNKPPTPVAGVASSSYGSTGSAAAGRMGFGGNGQSASSSSGGHFNRSQSDLHSRSPLAATAELPRVAGQQMGIPTDDRQRLRSPSPQGILSGSVDDPNGPSSSASATNLGSFRSPSPQTLATSSPGPGAASVSPMKFTSSSTAQSSPGAQRRDVGTASPTRIPRAAATISPDAKATKKGAKGSLGSDSFFSSTAGKSGGGLANSFSLGNVTAGASNVMEKLRGSSVDTSRPSTSTLASMIPSLANTSYAGSQQGFLNRHGNPSSSLPKEKEVGKNWKAHKVVLKDNSLLFYKLPNSVNEDVKNIFPTTVLRGAALRPLDAEMLKQSGLGTQDLLRATSSMGENYTTVRSPPMSPQRKAEPLPMMTSQPAGSSSWSLPGKHPDLDLVDSPTRPGKWVDCIQSASLPALVNEYVFASQASSATDTTEAVVLAQLLLYLTLATDCPIGQLIQYLKSEVSAALSLPAGTSTNGKKWASRSEIESLQEGVRLRTSICSEIILSDHVDQLTTDSSQAIEDLAALVGNRNLKANIALEQFRRLAIRPQPADWTPRSSQDSSRPAVSVLSASELLKLEPGKIAQQIQCFHAERLRALAVPRLWISRLVRDGEVAHAAASSLGCLFSFSGSRPHFLTTLAMEQILGSQNATDSVTASAAARQRASLVRHWLAVASYLLSYGDVLGWTAIVTALCSRAVARLEQTWRYVAEGDRGLLATSWAPKLAKMNWSEGGNARVEAALLMTAVTSRPAKGRDGSKPLALPYLGDSLVRAADIFAAGVQGDKLPCKGLSTEVARLYKVTADWWSDMCQHDPLDAMQIVAVGKAIPEMQQALQTLSSSTAFFAAPASFLTKSLELEPPSLGTLTPSLTLAYTPSTIAKASLPLLFPEALPNLDLLDRQELIRRANASGDSKGQSDQDPTIRGGFGGRYVRSPLAVAPVQRASSQSLARSKSFPPTESRAKTLPLNAISEWSSHGSAADEMLFRFDKDLIFKSTDDITSSLPSSPAHTSKRFSQDLTRSQRRLSQMSKRSSLPPSNRSSVADVMGTIQVTIKAASLDRLVDVVVFGVSHLTVTLSDDNGEAPLQAARASRLSVDLTAIRRTVLATFRSVCTPLALFEALRDRYENAVPSARAFNRLTQVPNIARFPEAKAASMAPEAEQEKSDAEDWEVAHRIRVGVLTVLRHWAQRYPQDFLDDVDVHAAFVDFIEQASQVTVADTGDVINHEKIVEGLAEVHSVLRTNMFRANARQAKRSEQQQQQQPKGSSSRRKDRSPPKEAVEDNDGKMDFDKATPAELVEYLECIGSWFFDKITERDLLVAAEVLERQALNPLGWYALRDSSTSDEPQVITMYKLMDLVNATAGSSSAMAQTSLLQCLPPAIRDICAAQSLLRGWVAIHIIEAKIGLERRQTRIEKLLDAVWICRARMINARSEDASTIALTPDEPMKNPTIASFVETVIVGSLTASESRTFVRAWQGVCHARGGKGDGLRDLLPPTKSLVSLNATGAASTATPDVGWLLRSIAQAVSRRSPVAESQDQNGLIDFEKRQTVFNLIDSSFILRENTSAESTGNDVANARLGRMQAQLRRVTWDRKLFREDAANEAALGSPLPAKTTYTAPRPLCGIAFEQAEKQQRDRAMFEQLKVALAAQEASRSQSAMSVGPSPSIGSGRSPVVGGQESFGRSSPLGANAHGSVAALASSSSSLAVVPVQATEKRSKRMTSLFRGAVRQTGLIVGGGSSSSSSSGGPATTSNAGNTDRLPEQSRSPLDLLNSVPSQKPTYVTSLAGAQSSIWNNTQRSFIFHITSLDGQHLLLQASNQAELTEWMAAIEKTIREAPLTPQQQQQQQQQQQRGGHDSAAGSVGAADGRRHLARGGAAQPLYGVDVKVLVEQEGRDVPAGLEKMLAEVEARGLREQGIYRISGAKNAIDGLKAAFSSLPASEVDLQTGEFSDVHTISGAIKLWFRELPEPAVPYDCYHRMIAAEGIEDHDERLYTLRDTIWSFSKPHFDLLKRIAQHLSKVADEGQVNLMYPHNLGLVFGTSLLNPPPSATSMVEGFGQLGKAAHVVKLIITFHEWLFEAEGEEAEAAEDVAAATVSTEPIAEEDVDGDARQGAELNGSQAHATTDVASQFAGLTVSAPTDEPDYSYDAVDDDDDDAEDENAAREGLDDFDVNAPLGPSLAGRRFVPRERAREESVYSDALDVVIPGSTADGISGSSPQLNSSSSSASATHLQPVVSGTSRPLAATSGVLSRSSLVPDEAMLEILRSMGAGEYEGLEGRLDRGSWDS